MIERLLRLIVGIALVVLLVWGGLWVIRIAGFGSLLAVSNETIEPVRPDIPFAPLTDTSRMGTRIVTGAPVATTGTVRSSYRVREFGKAVE